jgi:hypothetical protein
MMQSHCTRSRDEGTRRGTVLIIVLWTIAVAAIITSSVQLFGYRQATIGRQALEKVQARWAARAGLEDMLSVMRDHTERPFPDDAKAFVRDMYYAHHGVTTDTSGMTLAEYNIVHHLDGQVVGGPMDEHSKININRQEDRGLLMVFDDATLDIIDAVGDWLDEDDNISTLGVERDHYLSLDAPYLPRNGPMRSIGEMELVAGVWPRYFRGEDWNFNNRLDPNENDGTWSFPPDEPDEILDTGWAGRLTVHSTTLGPTNSGLPRIRLKNATVEELTERLGVNEDQATALIQRGRTSSEPLSDLITTPLALNASAASRPTGLGRVGGPTPEDENRSGRNAQPGAAQQTNTALSDDQLRAVLAETCIDDPVERLPGKINLNTVSPQLLRDIIDLLGIDEAIADEILYMRSSRPQGIPSLVDLKSIPNISTQDLQTLTRRFDTFSSVFTVTSRGRSIASGLEIEIIAVVDRSTVPIRILEYREQ